MALTNPFAKKNTANNNTNQTINQQNPQNSNVNNQNPNINNQNTAISQQNPVSPFTQQQVYPQTFNNPPFNNNPLLNNNANNQQSFNSNQLPFNNSQQLLFNNNQLPFNNNQQPFNNSNQLPFNINQQPFNNNQLPFNNSNQQPFNNNLQPFNNNQQPFNSNQALYNQSQFVNNINSQLPVNNINNLWPYNNQLSTDQQLLLNNQMNQTLLNSQANGQQQLQPNGQWPFNSQQQPSPPINQSATNTPQSQCYNSGMNQLSNSALHTFANSGVSPMDHSQQCFSNGYFGMPFNQFGQCNSYAHYDQSGQLRPLTLGGEHVSNILRSRWSDPLGISPLDKDDDVFRKMLFFISQGGKFENEVSNSEEFRYSGDKKIDELLKGLEFFYIQLANNQTKNDRIRECLKKLNLPELYLHSHPTLGEEWRRDLLLKNLQLSLPMSPEDLRKSQYFKDSIFTPLPKYLFEPLKYVSAVEAELKEIVREDCNPLAEEAYEAYLESPTGKYHGPDPDLKEMIKRDPVLAKQIIENYRNFKEYDDSENARPEEITRNGRKGYAFNEPERTTFEEDEMEKRYIEMMREATFLEYTAVKLGEEEEMKSEEYLDKMKRKREEETRESNRKKLFIEDDDGRFLIVPITSNSQETGKD